MINFKIGKQAPTYHKGLIPAIPVAVFTVEIIIRWLPFGGTFPDMSHLNLKGSMYVRN
jgi:hypothetical protein